MLNVRYTAVWFKRYRLAINSNPRCQNLTAWEVAAWDVPGIKSMAAMLPALPLSYMIYGKEKVDARRTGCATFPKADIQFPS